MIIESFLAKSLYDKITGNYNSESFADEQNGGSNGGFSFGAFLGSILTAVMIIAYLVVVIRAVMVAYNCQNLVQAVLALFMYPIYLVWNFTTMVQKGLCKVPTKL